MHFSFSAPATGCNLSTVVRLRVKACALLVLLVGGGPAFAADAPLTLAAAQRLAMLRSHQLAGYDHAAAASRDMAVAAGQLPDPILKAGIDNLPLSGADRFSLGNDFMTMRRIGVMQEVTGADKRQLRAERYEREAAKSVAEKTAALAAIERDTALAWLDRYYAERAAALLADQVAQARLEIDAAQAAYRGGRISQADVLAARSTLAQIEDRGSEQQRRLANAKTTLMRWAGPDADGPLAHAPSMDNVRLDTASLAAQLAHHPQNAVLVQQEQVAQLDAKLADSNRKPDWSVEFTFQQRGPAYANMASIGLSVPLQWDRKNRQDRELSAKLAMVEQARAEREEMLRSHLAETRVLMTEWASGRERQVRYERELIPLAADRSEAVAAAYRGGKASLLDLLATRRNETETRLQALQLQADTARLWAQLYFLVPANDVATNLPAAMRKESQ